MSGFVIGFGSTEQQFEEREECAIRDYIEERANVLGLDYFPDNFVGEVRSWIKARTDQLKATDASYKNADNYPDRYGYYSATVIADASHIVVIQRFLHTNRRHALSPDGWACLVTKRIFYVDNWADIQSKRAA